MIGDNAKYYPKDYMDDENKAACMNRAIQLHNDQQGIEPDIIVLMIGGNDALKGFAEMARCIIVALQ